MCERYIDWLPLAGAQLGNLAHNPGMCSDWELNQRPFGSQANVQSTEPHQPGLFCLNLRLVLPVLYLISRNHTVYTLLCLVFFTVHNVRYGCNSFFLLIYSRDWQTFSVKDQIGNNFKKYFIYCSGWCGSVDWVPACEPKGRWFNSQSEHMPGLWARSPVSGAWEATTHWHIGVSLSLFVPPFPFL